jgi:TRAP-type uncharacterized transport system substrate-binding protein
MKAVTLKKLAPVALLCTFALGSSAQESTGECGLRIATGPTTGVYTLLANDIQKVCGKVTTLCQVPSTGGLQNLMALSASEADIGFTQLDVLQKMGREGDQNIAALQAIMPMHANLLHILTKSGGSKIDGSSIWPLPATIKTFAKFSDLKGTQVALVGSAQLLGATLEKQTGYGMRFVAADTDDQAVAQLLAGHIQAVFTTGGWPYPAVSKHAATSGLMLADYDLSAQAPFAVVKRNYVKLNAFNMHFLAAPNLLVTRPFRPNGEKGKLVNALQSCILSHLDELQEGAYHAVWKEIKTPLDTLGVTRWEGPRVRTAQQTPRPRSTAQQGQRE